ncbi:MAG: hypothetical protein WCR30_01360 [Clostridia bacterium]
MRFNPKKFILTLCIFLGLITTLLILSYTVFSPKSIEINFLTTTNNLDGKELDIISVSDIKGSVFFFNRKLAKEKIEKAFPYSNVVGFEIDFPANVTIHLAERESLYAVKLTEYSYALVDENLKVLEKTNSFISTASNEILLDISIKNTNAKAGEFLEAINETEKLAIKNLKTALLRCDRGTIESKASFKSIYFQSEIIEGTEKNSLQMVIEDFNSFKTTVYDFEKKYSEKVECLFRAQSSITFSDIITKSMVVIETAEDGIVAVLIDA